MIPFVDIPANVPMKSSLQWENTLSVWQQTFEGKTTASSGRGEGERVGVVISVYQENSSFKVWNENDCLMKERNFEDVLKTKGKSNIFHS